MVRCSGHGDLFALLDQYFEVEDENGKRERRWLPEPFLWAVFHHLTVAGLLMEQGDLKPNPILHWATIVHRDLRASNSESILSFHWVRPTLQLLTAAVFLGENTSGEFKGYPLPKVGDFGLATYVPEDDSKGVDSYETMNWRTAAPVRSRVYKSHEFEY